MRKIPASGLIIGVITLAIIFPIYKYLGLVAYWPYEVPKELALLMLFIALPLGVQRLATYIVSVISWFLVILNAKYHEGPKN